jgi:hypothetical protein
VLAAIDILRLRLDAESAILMLPDPSSSSSQSSSFLLLRRRLEKLEKLTICRSLEPRLLSRAFAPSCSSSLTSTEGTTGAAPYEVVPSPGLVCSSGAFDIRSEGVGSVLGVCSIPLFAPPTLSGDSASCDLGLGLALVASVAMVVRGISELQLMLFRT